MHQHYQNKLRLQQEQKIYCKANRRQNILREHTASVDKKEYFNGTIFRY